jgi:transposase
MLTKMTDVDWATALQVFEASRSRRGDKGQDDRKFLEALHYFSVHNITWRALPAEFGKWNSVWKRFWRLSQSGVFDAFFETLAAMSTTVHLVQMFDSTVVRAHVSAAGAKGGSTARPSVARVVASLPRFHLKTDFGGLPIAFHLTSAEASDSRNFETLLDIGPDINPRAALGDKGYEFQVKPRGHTSTRNMSGNPISIQHQRHSRILSESSLQSSRSYRANSRQAQTIQAHRAALR